MPSLSLRRPAHGRCRGAADRDRACRPRQAGSRFRRDDRARQPSDGRAQLESIRYSAGGTGCSLGQFFVPDVSWPKITVHALTRSVDCRRASMRDEVTPSRAEPRGGGGHPLQGQQRNDQYV